MTGMRLTYNPGMLGDTELVHSFVVRYESLELILEALRENAASSGANRHQLIIGPRGIGKTMLVRRVAAEVRSNPAYAEHWYPLVFGEESYQISTAGEFWLEALFHLAEEPGEESRRQVVEELRAEGDEARLRERALGQLLDFADRQGKRLLLVVENLNMLLDDQMNEQAAWDLRHALANERRLMLLATATSRFKGIDNAGQAWFEMFSIHELSPLGHDDCGMLWRSATDVSLEPRPLRAIRILTGGNPRLLRILASFAAKRSFHELMDQLVHLIDDHTEYFKSHLDGLAPKERKVFVALLDKWDPVSAAEVAALSRLKVGEVSALLGRLVERGAVEVADKKGRRRLYQASERLYNLYYLMRRRGHPADRIQMVVRFMVMFYEGDELISSIGELAREACELAAGMRKDHYQAYVEILQRAEGLQERIFLSTPPEFFEAEDAPEPIRALPRVLWAKQLKRAVDLLRESVDLMVAGRFDAANGRYREAEECVRKAIELHPPEPMAWEFLGSMLASSDRWEAAAQVFRRVIELVPENASAWQGLGEALREMDRLNEAERACRKAIELDAQIFAAWRDLGLTLEKLGRKREGEEALRRSIELAPGDCQVWTALGQFLHSLGRLEEAELALRKAVGIRPSYWPAVNRLIEIRVQQGVNRQAIFEEAESWAREAWAQRPILDNALGLTRALTAQGKWIEALDVNLQMLRADATKEGARREVAALSMLVAADGHAAVALEKLQSSAGAAALEPLVIGLRIYLGETPQVAKEILEIGQDVAGRIREMRNAKAKDLEAEPPS
jgi:tetratricopeptide (TPR) repeat protein